MPATGTTTLLVDPDGIPATLRGFPDRWGVWQWEQRDGKRTKIPYKAVGHGRASSNNPAGWGTFDAAIARMRGYDGLAFRLGVQDDAGRWLTCIDLDHCSDGVGRLPHLDQRARHLAYDFRGTFVERSPSATGLHIWCWADQLPPGSRGKGVEIYQAAGPDQGRYMTVTGQVFADHHCDVADYSDRVAKLHAERIGRRAARAKGDGPAHVTFAAEVSEATRAVIDTMRLVDVEFDRTWAYDRPDFSRQSPSEYRFSVVGKMAHAGWPQQIAADVARAWYADNGVAWDDGVERRMRNYDLPKQYAAARERFIGTLRAVARGQKSIGAAVAAHRILAGREAPARAALVWAATKTGMPEADAQDVVRRLL